MIMEQFHQTIQTKDLRVNAKKNLDDLFPFQIILIFVQKVCLRWSVFC
jgi:hypothetical protein